MKKQVEKVLQKKLQELIDDTQSLIQELRIDRIKDHDKKTCKRCLSGKKH